MAYPGLAWQKLELPFAAGLNQKTDDRARPQPYLDICKDAQFDETGGLQARLPFASSAGAISGGGTIADARRIEPYGNEAVLFTKDSVYSWNAQQSAWVLRGTHLAVAVTETPRFATTGDQIDGDRAELNGTVVFAWTEGAQVYAAAMDKTTESVLVQPTPVTTAIGRPRLVALATKILLFVEATTTLLTVRSIDPATPSTGIGGPGTNVLLTDFNLNYDVVKVGSQDLCVGACRRVTTTSYTAFLVTPSMVVTAVTKARTCDGPIAVSTIPDGTKTQVVRANGTNIQGDLLTTSSLADSITGQAIGTVLNTPVNQIAACHRSVQNSGAFRCYAFWSAQESTSTCTWVSKFNFVDSGGTIGTEANFIRHLGIASRAFDYNGSVYVWLAFGGASTFNGAGPFFFSTFQTQNTYFLFRDDQYLSNAKSIAGHAGGFAATTGRLPGVALTSGTTIYSWCGTQRRRLELGGVNHVGFAAREPVDVTFEFDANRARRCARLGDTLYIAGGEVMQYDGVRLVELGHHVYPWVFGLLDAAAGGTVAVGTYAYQVTWRYLNAKGETDRSTTATIGQVTVTGNSTSIPSPFAPLTATHKTAVPPAVEVWRTAVNPPGEAPFYLTTSNDPTALTNPNRYIPNDPTAASLPTFNDFLADATLTALEANPENDGALENLAPPPANIIVATETRLFLGDVAGDPHRVWYSKQRVSGQVAAFHDTLVIDVPRVGGAITSIWFLDGVLYVGRQTAIYAFAGFGSDNTGGGSNFSLARIVSEDIGVANHESVALTPAGVILKSSKGWQLLRGNGQLDYIGDKVADYDSEAVLAVNVVETQYQVRILTASRMLIWDYRVNQWGEWTITDGLHACMFGGAHVYLAATGTRTQRSTYTSLTYGMDVAETWIKPNGLMGAAKVRRLQVFGEYRSAHLLRLRIAYNYDETVVDDVIWTPTAPTGGAPTVGGPLQMMHAPQRPRCEAIKVRVTAVTEASRATLVTSGTTPQVATSGTVWTSTWSAVASKPGELGNTVSLAISFEAGANLVDVRDHFAWNPSTGSWGQVTNRVGVRVRCQAGTLTVAALETAIAAATALMTLTAADATPSKTINIATMAGQIATAALSGGAYGSPTGEALKLTGLGLEVGVEKATLYAGLSTAQKA